MLSTRVSWWTCRPRRAAPLDKEEPRTPNGEAHAGVMGAQPRTIRKLARALGVEPEELVRTEG
jgi:hypothetical protein